MPVENLFDKMPVVEVLFFRRQPPTLVVGGKAGALRSVEQIAGRHGQIFSCFRVVLKTRQLEKEEFLEHLPVLHSLFLPQNDCVDKCRRRPDRRERATVFPDLTRPREKSRLDLAS